MLEVIVDEVETTGSLYDFRLSIGAFQDSFEPWKCSNFGLVIERDQRR